MPIDFPEILSAIAPRPMLVIATSLDWHHSQSSIAEAIKAAKSAYGLHQAADKLQLYSPVCLAEFNNDIQSQITRFLQGP